MATKTNHTNREKQIKHFLAALSEMIGDKREDIQTGIEEGLYEKKENVDTLKYLDELDKEIKVFQKTTPAIYIKVEGGMIQGISGTEKITVNIYDVDNEENDSEYVEENGTEEEWNAEVTRMEEAGDLVGIF